MATKDRVAELEQIPNIFRRKEYGIWKNLIEICHNPSHPKYKSIGGTGIEVTQLWREKKKSRGYLHFLGDMGFMPDSTCTIRRINHREDFKPSNCIWYSKTGYYVRNENGCIQISIMRNGLFDN
jgi:hypothetical protein